MEQEQVKSTDDIGIPISDKNIEILAGYLIEEIAIIHNARKELHRKYPQLLGEFNE